MRKVKISGLPKASQGREVDSGNQAPPIDNSAAANIDIGDTGSNKSIKVNRTLKPVKPEHANLEAEKGETAVTDLSKEGLPEFYEIGGKDHSKGGTPLNLPPNSFIFSKDKSLKCKDPDLLAQFGKSPKKGKKGYTPAELSRTYNINKYRRILADPDSDHRDIDTAELMIQNYMDKLGALALVQESKKGFDNGIPALAQPYMDKVGISGEDLIPKEDQQPQGPPQGSPQGPPPPEMQMSPDQMAAMGPQGPPPQGPPQEMPPQMAQGKEGGETPLRKYNPGGPTTNQTPPNVGETKSQYMSRVYNNPGTFQDNSTWDGTQWIPAGQQTGPGGNPPQDDGDGKTKPVSSERPTGKQNIPKDATLWDPDSDGWDESQVQSGDYVKRNGRWYKQTKQVASVYNGTPVDQLDAKLNGEFGDLREAYGRLEHKLNNDAEVKAGFIENFRANIGKLKPQGLTTQADIDKLKGLDDQGLIDHYLHGNRNAMILNANLGDIKNLKNAASWDTGKTGGLPTAYVNAAKKLGIDPLSTAQTTAHQAGYITMENMKQDDKYKESLSDYQLPKVGVADESGESTGLKNISEVDGWWGNTTAGQMQLYRDKSYKFEEKEADWLQDEKEKATEHLYEQTIPERNPYWTQDVLSTANSLHDYMGVKKYNPWQATPDVSLAQPNFADFRGAASRLGSTAAAGAQQLGTFGTPQAFGAGFANIQRQNAQAVGQLQDQEYKTNVATANQFELANTQTRNQGSLNRANLATQLYDKNTIANQQYDNSKRALKHNVVNNINTALTNRGMTQSLNTRTDQFKVDPTTGFTRFTGDSREILPGAASTGDPTYAKAQGYMNDNPGMEWADAIKLASPNKYNTPPYSNQTYDPYGASIPGQYPGGAQQGQPRRKRKSGYRQQPNPYTAYRKRGGSAGKRKCRILTAI
jgi:hypothetical protein